MLSLCLPYNYVLFHFSFIQYIIIKHDLKINLLRISKQACNIPIAVYCFLGSPVAQLACADERLDFDGFAWAFEVAIHPHVDQLVPNHGRSKQNGGIVFLASFSLLPHYISHIQKREFISCSHCQELCQLADLASNWLSTVVKPIRSQLACGHNSWQWLQVINFHPRDPSRLLSHCLSGPSKKHLNSNQIWKKVTKL